MNPLNPSNESICHLSLSIPPRKHQEIKDFLMFSGGIERDQWHYNHLRYLHEFRVIKLNTNFNLIIQVNISYLQKN